VPVYGDCLSSNGFEQITKMDLRETHCRVVFPQGRVPDDRVLTIWLGAIGPITGETRQRSFSGLVLELHEKVDERVVRHFACV